MDGTQEVRDNECQGIEFCFSVLMIFIGLCLPDSRVRIQLIQIDSDLSNLLGS